MTIDDLTYGISFATIDGITRFWLLSITSLVTMKYSSAIFPLAEILADLNITFMVLLVFTILLIIFGLYTLLSEAVPLALSR